MCFLWSEGSSSTHMSVSWPGTRSAIATLNLHDTRLSDLDDITAQGMSAAQTLVPHLNAYRPGSQSATSVWSCTAAAGIPSTFVHARVKQVCPCLGLTPAQNNRHGAYTGKQQQKVIWGSRLLTFRRYTCRSRH